MRIAVIPTIRDFPWGAPGHCMGGVVRALSQAGHEVLWLVAPIDLNHPEVGKLRSEGVRVVPLPAPPPRYGRFVSLRRRIRSLQPKHKSLAAIMNAFNPQHIFVNQGGTWCGLQDEFWDVLSPRSGNYSLICHLNQPQPSFGGPWLERGRQLMLGAKHVCFPSEWTKRLAEIQIAAAIPNHRRFQCPIRFKFDEPLPWPQAAVPRFAMVCRLDAFQKGIDVAFAAFAQIHREGLRFTCHIFGTGPDESHLSGLASFLGIESVVTFSGYNSDLRQIWLDHEMLLLPSRFEGSAVSALEALGFGRPVLTTNVGGAEEWIKDGWNGFICPAPEVALLCETLRRAIAAHPAWPEMGRKAFQKIKRDLDPDPSRMLLKALES